MKTLIEFQINREKALTRALAPVGALHVIVTTGIALLISWAIYKILY